MRFWAYVVFFSLLVLVGMIMLVERLTYANGKAPCLRNKMVRTNQIWRRRTLISRSKHHNLQSINNLL